MVASGVVFAAGLVVASAGEARAQKLENLPPGSPQRAEILEALRPSMEWHLRGPIEFRVVAIRAKSGWALVHADPIRPGGKPIAVKETFFAANESMMDGLRIDALLQRRNGRWNLIAFEVGATDAAFTNWQSPQVPDEVIFGKKLDD
jgi:hypothetical protein